MKAEESGLSIASFFKKNYSGENIMNVLSLFDGISCARIALEKINIPVDNYFASEIDKFAISVSKKTIL